MKSLPLRGDSADFYFLIFEISSDVRFDYYY